MNFIPKYPGKRRDFPLCCKCWNWCKMMSVLENVKRATKTWTWWERKKKKPRRAQILELSKWVQSQLYQSLGFDLEHIVYPFFFFCLSILICKVDTIRVSTYFHQSTVHASFPWKQKKEKQQQKKKTNPYRCLPTENISSSYIPMRVSYLYRRALLQVVIQGSSCAHHLVLLLWNSWPWNPGLKNMGKAIWTLSTSVQFSRSVVSNAL